VAHPVKESVVVAEAEEPRQVVVEAVAGPAGPAEVP
jgi:hypothetical protein